MDTVSAYREAMNVLGQILSRFVRKIKNGPKGSISTTDSSFHTLC